MAVQPSQAMQDYLKAIHTLGGADGVVSPVDIAAQLDVRAPSVTGMLKRLAEAGWIRYEPGAGCRLTERGIAEARFDVVAVNAAAIAFYRAQGRATSRPMRSLRCPRQHGGLDFCHCHRQG